MVVVADVADYKAMWCCVAVRRVIYQGGAHQEISLLRQKTWALHAFINDVLFEKPDQH